MTNKDKYISFCNKMVDLPIFYEPKWWDCLNNEWSVICFDVAGVDYYLPYITEKKWSFSFIRNPHLTPYSGLIYDRKKTIKPENLDTAFKLALTKLPRVSEIDIDFYPSSFSPQENNKLTHILSLNNTEEIRTSYKSSLKRQIKKAEKKLQVNRSTDLKPLLSLHSQSLQRQKTASTLDQNTANRLFNYTERVNKGILYYAQNEVDGIHAGLWVVYDNNCIYYLLGGSNPNFLGSGAMGLLLSSAIQDAIDLNLDTFDFEGSMLPGIARFFKTFGAHEVKYPVLKKEASLALRLLRKIKKS